MAVTVEPNVLSAGTLIGDPVRNLDDETLGRVKEFMIDTATGRIAYAVLSVGGFLGLGDKLFAIPWNLMRVDADNRCFRLDVTKERLEESEGFDPAHWPEMADRDWAERVHAHFHAEPYWPH